MKKRLLPMIFLTLVCTMMAACSQEVAIPPEKDDAPVTAPVTPTPEQPGKTAPAFPYTAPLTGLGVSARSEGRPVMVMVNNHPKARPQSGLDKADIVYELLAEGEVTRFVAIYQSQKPQVIGPVRSIRPYFIQIGAGFDAVMVHAGGSPEALETLAHSDYSNINEISNGKYFWREKFRKAPHNLYTDLTRIEQAMKDKGMRTRTELPYLPFLPANAAITTGERAENINVEFHHLYKVSYQYDPKTKRYLRFTEGEPHLDLTTNQQLSVTNLLVIAAKHRVLDSEGRRQVDVVGPGDGYLFQQGKVQPVKWKKSGGIIRAYAVGGENEELPLLPGNTWVNIVPDVPGLKNEVNYQ